MLIATLPAIYQEELMEKIISCPEVSAVRYNIGAASPYSPKETLEKILTLTATHKKILWVDLKGRQLRITQWATPIYGKIILNHEVDVDLPARIFFRGNEWSQIKFVRGNQVFVDPPPQHAVGAGQAVNIIGENLRIKGYLTEEDESYMAAARELGVMNFMLSFVEHWTDIWAVQKIVGEKNDMSVVLKIESQRGLHFVETEFCDDRYRCMNLMAARDDLMINIGENKAKMIAALKQIIAADPQAILASRIFAGLDGNGGHITMGDISDLHLMHEMGYKHFMFSDGLCQRHFVAAIDEWKKFQEARNGQ